MFKKYKYTIILGLVGIFLVITAFKFFIAGLVMLVFIFADSSSKNSQFLLQLLVIGSPTVLILIFGFIGYYFDLINLKIAAINKENNTNLK